MMKFSMTEAWPPDYSEIYAERIVRHRNTIAKGLASHAVAYYAEHPVKFIEHWCCTYDPRKVGTGLPTNMPFMLFPKQKELVLWFHALVLDQENGLIEKSRDMGATWCACAFSVWLWLFYPGSSVGWGSRKEMLVDRAGDPDSIFEKVRMLIRGLPGFLKPSGLNENRHLSFLKCINPANGSTITGEAGDMIGRGGRKLIFFKDESSHYERAERIEAALADNTNVQVDISSVNGAGNLFYRKRHSGLTRVFVMDWRHHPDKNQKWYDKRKAKAESEGTEHIFAQEVDRDYTSAVEGIFIPAKYVNAAIDAHIKLGFEPVGVKKSGLDVADEGGDANVQIDVHGPVLTYIDMWKKGDTGFTAKKAYNHCIDNGLEELVYDSVGVGAGVKGKTNELLDKALLKAQEAEEYDEETYQDPLIVIPFNAGAGVVGPKRKYAAGKKNADMFYNHIAQSMWHLRTRFVKTYNMVNNINTYDFSELISIPSNLPHVNDLKTEISTPLRETDEAGRVRRESKKAMKKRGMKSGNYLEALVQCYCPLHRPRTPGVHILNGTPHTPST